MPHMMLTHKEPQCAAIAYGNYMRLDIPVADWGSSEEQPFEFFMRFLNCLYSQALCWYPAYTLGVPCWSLRFRCLTIQSFQNYRGEVSEGRGLEKTAEIPSVYVYANTLNTIY